MRYSWQNETPKARINLKLELNTGDMSKKTKILVKLWVACDFSKSRETGPLYECKKTVLNKHNFDAVFYKYSAPVNPNVSNILASDGKEENTSQTFPIMKDFSLEQVSRKISQLKTMLSNCFSEGNLLDIA
ncbi:type VI secretion system contractile sheath small subunit [Salmonella enterica subsp. enterica]|nr:type VI secretion system contractile sheath small subunit [Salmonella enterica subsp. enterica]